MAFATGEETKCEVCGTLIVGAWWWADEDPASERKVRKWLEVPALGRTLAEAEHTPERCLAARAAR